MHTHMNVLNLHLLQKEHLKGTEKVLELSTPLLKTLILIPHVTVKVAELEDDFQQQSKYLRVRISIMWIKQQVHTADIST